MGRAILKVIGLQRSGTNYLDGLVSRNFEDIRFVPHRVLWKHEFAHNAPPEFPAEATVLMVHKSPYAWIESLHRNAKDLWKYHDLAADGPQITIRRGSYEGMRITVSLARLCDLYSRYHLGWLRSGRRVVALPFERLISDVDGVVDQLVGLGLRRRADDELDLDFEVNQSRPLTDADRAKLADPTDYDLDAEILDAITELVDPDVWAALDRTPLAAQRDGSNSSS